MGISLPGNRVDLAHVSRGAGGRPEVHALVSYRRERPAEEALAILRRQHGLARHRCATVLGAGEYQMLQLEAPEVPRGEVKDAVRWRVKDMIDYPPESATIDLVEIPASPEGGTRARGLHVFCARNEVIGARMKLFDGAKVPLEAIDVPEMALRNVAALWAGPKRALALIAFDDTGGTLVIVAGGELYASRRIEATEGDLSDPDEASRQPHLERIALELQRSFDYYDRQFGSAPLEKLVVAAPRAAELADYLRPILYVPVEAADLGAVMDFPAVPELRDPARQAQCLVTLGLALRGEEAAP
ncbi:MAG: agglutinin biogenesis protein MshI [Burkholderiales bacterium]